MAETIAIGKKVSDEIGVLLNFHYSDFWADAETDLSQRHGKIFNVSASWNRQVIFSQIAPKSTLEAGVNVTMIQVGNEVTNDCSGRG